MRQPSRKALASSRNVEQPLKLAAHPVPIAAIARSRLACEAHARPLPLAGQWARESKSLATAPSNDGLGIPDIRDVDPPSTGLAGTGRRCNDLHELVGIFIVAMKLELVLIHDFITQFDGVATLGLVKWRQRALHDVKGQVVLAAVCVVSPGAGSLQCSDDGRDPVAVDVSLCLLYTSDAADE